MSLSPSPSASLSPMRSDADAGIGCTLVAELKTRARLGLKAIRAGDLGLLQRAKLGFGRAAAQPPEWKLRHCLALVANEAGFTTWDQARHVLGGQATSSDDMGAFWHAPRCNGLLSHWFADHVRARTCLAEMTQSVLLPYRRQFVVVDENYLRELGVPRASKHWDAADRDLAWAYGGSAWLALCQLRLTALREAR